MKFTNVVWRTLKLYNCERVGLVGNNTPLLSGFCKCKELLRKMGGSEDWEKEELASAHWTRTLTRTKPSVCCQSVRILINEPSFSFIGQKTPKYEKRRILGTRLNSCGMDGCVEGSSVNMQRYPDRPSHNFVASKICRTTFRNYIKFADLLILRL